MKATLPIKVTAGQRYFVDSAGVPFLLRGEAAWGLITKLTREEVDAYLEDRRLKGINAVVVMLVSHHFLIGAPTNAYGADPFTVFGDFGTPNEAYFQHADYVIAKAAEKGMVVILAPAYCGYAGGSDEGWFPWMVSNGAAKMRAWGNYVANRYKASNNIVWLIGGDYSPGTQAEKDVVKAVALGIQDIIPGALQTFHGGRGTSALGYWGTGESWLTVNDIYTDESTVGSAARTEFARSTKPFFHVEGRYEGSNSADARVVRLQAYQAALSGAVDGVIGVAGLWEFNSDWRTLLNTSAALSMPVLTSTLGGSSWWKLVPDTANTFLTSGAGSGQELAVAGVANDRSFGMAYMPSVRSITIDMSRLAGPKVAARWIDPVSGTSITLPGSPYPATGVQSLQPASANSGGAGDWILRLDSTP